MPGWWRLYILVGVACAVDNGFGVKQRIDPVSDRVVVGKIECFGMCQNYLSGPAFPMYIPCSGLSQTLPAISSLEVPSKFLM